jgi:hypothetical protein
VLVLDLEVLLVVLGHRFGRQPFEVLGWSMYRGMAPILLIPTLLGGAIVPRVTKMRGWRYFRELSF